MKNDIKNILRRLDDIEHKYEKIEQETSSEENTFSCSTFTKNLINYPLLEKKRFFVAEFDVKKNISLYITYQVEGVLQTNQKILISIYIDGIQVHSSTKSLLSGVVETISFATFTSKKNKHVKAEVEITPLQGVLFTVSNINLVIVGLSKNEVETKYDILDVGDNFLLSATKNNLLYYSYILKTNSENNLQNFTFYKNAISHSFVYLKNLKELTIFRVDIGGRLFYCTDKNRNEIFIDKDVSFVSSATNGTEIYACYIKKNYCYIAEIRKNTTKPIVKRIKFNICALKSCLIYYNELRQKFYLILSDNNNSNYLIESVDENFSHGENISASYSISISSYTEESNSEVFNS